MQIYLPNKTGFDTTANKRVFVIFFFGGGGGGTWHVAAQIVLNFQSNKHDTAE